MIKIAGYGNRISGENAAVKMKDASFPKPFPGGLEYNSPVHGTWNIVHTGMQVPEAIQIYVCAKNCMRGVVLTAAEMKAADRFSFVILEEKDILNGNLEDITIEGVADVLQKRKDHPKAVLLFTVCLHHFMGSSLDYIYRSLEKRFPNICFLRCYMDPIMQKEGLTPDQKLRKAMYDPMPLCKEDRAVSILGSDFPLDEESDMKRLLGKYNIPVRELPGSKKWQELLDMGKSSLFLNIYPAGKYGMQEQAKRLKRKGMYLPASFDYEEIEDQLKKMTDALGLPQLSRQELDAERFCCEDAFKKAKEEIGDTPIALDYTYHPRTLGLAKLLIRHGFLVKEVYLDSFNPEERSEFFWLKEYAPDLEILATNQPQMRIFPRKREEKWLAIGQKAAYFCGSPYFVNLVQGEGMYGFEGIRKTAELMIEAFREEKDTKRLVIQKGWGCESCL